MISVLGSEGGLEWDQGPAYIPGTRNGECEGGGQGAERQAGRQAATREAGRQAGRGRQGAEAGRQAGRQAGRRRCAGIQTKPPVRPAGRQQHSCSVGAA